MIAKQAALWYTDYNHTPGGVYDGIYPISAEN